MPHKRNPIVTERITGIARLLRGYAQAGLEDVALWHERDISHSSVERVALPDATILLDYAQHLAARVVEGHDRGRRSDARQRRRHPRRAVLPARAAGPGGVRAARATTPTGSSRRTRSAPGARGSHFRELLAEAAPELDLDAVFDPARLRRATRRRSWRGWTALGLRWPTRVQAPPARALKAAAGRADAIRVSPHRAGRRGMLPLAALIAAAALVPASAASGGTPSAARASVAAPSRRQASAPARKAKKLTRRQRAAARRRAAARKRAAARRLPPCRRASAPRPGAAPLPPQGGSPQGRAPQAAARRRAAACRKRASSRAPAPPRKPRGGRPWPPRPPSRPPRRPRAHAAAAPVALRVRDGAASSPSPSRAPIVGAGSVTIELRNVGEDPHDLVVSAEGSGDRGGALRRARRRGRDGQEDARALGRAATSCGARSTGHEQLGMSATLTVADGAAPTDGPDWRIRGKAGQRRRRPPEGGRRSRVQAQEAQAQAGALHGPQEEVQEPAQEASRQALGGRAAGDGEPAQAARQGQAQAHLPSQAQAQAGAKKPHAEAGRAKAPVPLQPVPPPPVPPKPPFRIASPIAVYSGPFGVREAERLLWRAGFGPSPGHAAGPGRAWACTRRWPR